MKTYTTKKIISIILAIMMVATMAPMSFALDAEYELKTGEPLTITMPEVAEETYIYIKFVPETDGMYSFVSNSGGNGDPRAVLCDTNGNELTSGDDSNGNHDFLLTCELEAGATYYLGVLDIHNGAREWEIRAYIPCTTHTGGIQTCLGYKCEACGEWYGEGNDNHSSSGDQTCLGYWCDLCNEWYGEGNDEHTDDDNDGYCNDCGEVFVISPNVDTIKVGDTYTVTQGGYVKFIPTETGTYILSSVSDSDPKVTLYDSNSTYIYHEDDSYYRDENGRDFRLTYEYTAGETYYFKFYDYSGAYNYTVTLTERCTSHTGGTQTCMGYKCEKCGEWYGEQGEHTTSGEQTCMGYWCDLCNEWYGEGTGVHIDDDEDGSCDHCPTPMDYLTYAEIKVGDTYIVTKSEYVKFVPTVTGTYIILSVSDLNPTVTIYDSHFFPLRTEEDSEYRDENSYDFRLAYEFTAGETYYFQLRDHTEEYNYTVKLIKECSTHTGGTQTCKGYKCEACGEWYGEAGNHKSTGDQTCMGYCCDYCDQWFGTKDENKHSWNYGDCEYCEEVFPEGAECEHSWDSDGECIICGVSCPHEAFENGICTNCCHQMPFLLITDGVMTYYESFTDALEAAEDGSTIKLMSSDNMGDESLEINKAITLDLNGNSFDQISSCDIIVNAHVHFTDTLGGGYVGYEIVLNSSATFTGGSYNWITISSEINGALDDFIPECCGYYDKESDTLLDLSSETSYGWVTVKAVNHIPSEDDGNPCTDITCTACGASLEKGVLLGDMNQDGIVDYADYDILIQIVTLQLAPTEEQKYIGDLNGDGAVDGLDAVYLELVIDGYVEQPDGNVVFAQPTEAIIPNTKEDEE